MNIMDERGITPSEQNISFKTQENIPKWHSSRGFKLLAIVLLLFTTMLISVKSTTITLPSGDTITINVNAVTGSNGTGGWNQTGNQLNPSVATSNIRIQTLISCDTIDTDADGDLACGTDASGSDPAAWKRANTTDQIGDNASLLRTINQSNINVSNATYASGVNWAKIAGVPAGFADNVDDTGSGSESTNESDINVTVVFVYKNLTINRTINFTTDGIGRFSGAVYSFGKQLNFSIDLSLYNQSISLADYNKSISLLNYQYEASAFKIDNGTRLPFSNMQLSNISNNTIPLGANESIALWNITTMTDNILRYLLFPRHTNISVLLGYANYSKNYTDVLTVRGNATFDGNLTVIGEITSKGRIVNTSISLDDYNKSISLVNYQYRADAWNIANNDTPRWHIKWSEQVPNYINTSNFGTNWHNEWSTDLINYVNNTNSLNVLKNNTNVNFQAINITGETGKNATIWIGNTSIQTNGSWWCIPDCRV